MKKILLSIVALLGVAQAWALEYIDDSGIWYDLNTSERTAKVLQFSGYLPDGSLTIPSSVVHEDVEYRVTSIEERAFNSSTNISSITIPASVTSIGSSAFYFCI